MVVCSTSNAMDVVKSLESCAVPIKYVTKFSPLLNLFEKICPNTTIEPYLRTKFSKIHDMS
jgi:hypothetical protein